MKHAITALLVSMGVGVFAQQRDAPVQPVGTGEISGVVLGAAGDASTPVRRVVVTIAGDLPSHRSVVTDDTGRFVFSRLPAGTFTVTARKAGYLATEHGSSKPGRPGSRVALAAGERRAITLTIHKGAVIAGTLRDSSGQPLAGVQVAAIETRAAALGTPVPPEITTSDDRGAYRIFGLMPGEYAIQAGPAPIGMGDIGTRSTEELDALFAALKQRTDRLSSTPATSSSLPPAQPISYAPIYYPGTPLFSEASRIRVAAGDERGNITFDVNHVPASTIEGVVSGAAVNPAAVQLAIIPDAPRVSMGTAGITSIAPNERGEFKYGNVPPGKYRIVARARAGVAAAASTLPPGAVSSSAGLSGGVPPPGANLGPGAEMLYAIADIEVRGQDVRGISLTLQPGGTLAGKVVFDAEKAQPSIDLAQVRAGAYIVGGSFISQAGSTRVGNALSSVPPVNLNDDGTFSIVGLGPSQYQIVCQLPAQLQTTWKLRSAIVGGRDLLDTLIDGPAVNLKGITITLSDKRTELIGTLQSASGQPVSEYYVIAFSADRANWRQGARRNLSTRPATDGKFVFTDLPSGEYFIAALTDLDPLDWQSPSFLEQVVPAAVKVTVPEGQRTVQDLRIR